MPLKARWTTEPPNPEIKRACKRPQCCVSGDALGAEMCVPRSTALSALDAIGNFAWA
jgi:hypothetical protein